MVSDGELILEAPVKLLSPNEWREWKEGFDNTFDAPKSQRRPNISSSRDDPAAMVVIARQRGTRAGLLLGNAVSHPDSFVRIGLFVVHATNEGSRFLDTAQTTTIRII
jgi:hypothetical protein